MTRKRVLTHTYVIPLQDRSMFKIGMSNDFASRHKFLEKCWGKFDLDCGFIITSVQNWTSHKRVESFLHHTFDEYRINDLPRICPGDGSTEFFEMECFDDVRKFSDMYAGFRNRHDKVTTITVGAKDIDSLIEQPYKT
jgi:hypothetical protein